LHHRLLAGVAAVTVVVGVGTACAVLIDAFIVRALLVPSIASA